MQENLETRLAKRIARKWRDVFLREDFNDLGGYDQVGRALRQLVRGGKLTKIGYGLYARAVPSRFGGASRPANGLETLKEGLRRVGVQPKPSRLEQEYNAGQTTQVPTGRVVGVDKRVRRKIGYNGVFLSFERARPAAR
jgi:hypothetical protein